jgi:hypothetical protein
VLALVFLGFGFNRVDWIFCIFPRRIRRARAPTVEKTERASIGNAVLDLLASCRHTHTHGTDTHAVGYRRGVKMNIHKHLIHSCPWKRASPLSLSLHISLLFTLRTHSADTHSFSSHERPCMFALSYRANYLRISLYFMSFLNARSITATSDLWRPIQRKRPENLIPIIRWARIYNIFVLFCFVWRRIIRTRLFFPLIAPINQLCNKLRYSSCLYFFVHTRTQDQLSQQVYKRVSLEC